MSDASYKIFKETIPKPGTTPIHNPMHNLIGNENEPTETTTSALPSFWTMVRTINQAFFPIYFIEVTKAAINATNTSTLASLGKDEAAAVAFISSTVVLYCVAFTAINFYLFNLLPNNKTKHEIIIFYALLLNLSFGCALGLVSFFTGDFLHAIGTPSKIANIISDFYSVFAFAVPSIFLFLAWQVISVATGKQNIAFTSSSIAALSAVIWTIATCVLESNAIETSPGKLIGASYVMGYGLGTSFYLSYFVFHRLLVLPSYKNFIENLALLTEWVAKGVYGVGHITCELISLILQSVLVVAQMNCSTSDLATIAVLNYWNLNTVTFAIAMGLATNYIMSQTPKSGNRDQIRQNYGNTGLRICVALNCIVFIGSMISPKAFVNAAGVNRDDIDYSDNMLRLFFAIQCAGLAANSRRDVLPGILRANDIVKTPMMASLAAQGMGLVGQYVLGVVAKMQVLGLQLGYYGGLILGDAYLELVWYRNSDPAIARENRENPATLAKADSFVGQVQTVITFFKKQLCDKTEKTEKTDSKSIPAINAV